MPEKTFKIINGDSLEELKKFPDNYFDSIVTDPPYGLGKEPDATEMLKAWVETGYMEVKGTGFMGKKWDAFVPQPLFWKEVYRVLKHGGHVAAFFGTRTYDWGCMAIRLAGFEIRDSLQYVYGSGFPKSLNVGKAIDKIQGNEREIIGVNPNHRVLKKTNTMVGQPHSKDGMITLGKGKWEGWGSALKPAVEPIVLARKPLEKGLNVAQNVLKWGTGGLNIDGCRVGKDLIKGQKAGQGFNKVKGFGVNTKLGEQNAKEYISEDTNGRFPANLLLSHHSDCEFKGMKKVKPSNGSGKASENGGGFSKGMFGDGTADKIGGGFIDENGEETVEDWNCVDGCPIKIMDEQSGETKGTIRKPNGNPILNVKNGWNDNSMIDNTIRGHNDSGGASRFFYTAKASKSERNFGLDGFDNKQSVGGGGGIGNYLEDVNSASGKYGSEKAPSKNFHPTVKPVKLLQFLTRLITPPNGKVLDPFNGSGTTGIACMLEGFEYTGIELDAEYCKISEARILAWNEIEEYEDYKKIIENNEDNEEEDSKGGTQISLFD